MIVTLSKVSFGDRNLTVSTVAKLDASISTGKIRANELFPMLNGLWYDKVSSLCIVENVLSCKIGGMELQLVSVSKGL